MQELVKLMTVVPLYDVHGPLECFHKSIFYELHIFSGIGERSGSGLLNGQQ